MTLYLTPELTPDEIRKAKEVGVTGVKSYPRGVTTNSEFGVESYETYYPVFEAMEEADLILHLHGEVPAGPGISVMNAEEKFLDQLLILHASFPTLKIVLEHVSTAAAVEAVKKCGPTVAATVTAHHLDITIDDVVGCCHNFCKPVPKLPTDRDAIRQVVKEGHPRFFLGSDSAPHARSKKEGGAAAAGVFTSAYLLPYVANTFEEMGCLERLTDFVAGFGADFFGLERKPNSIRLVRADVVVGAALGDSLADDAKVVPFRAGRTLAWKMEEL
jgi:dihydroorotase